MAVQKFDPADLLEFIAKAHRNTYAAPPEVRKVNRVLIPTLPGHKDYHFQDGLWSYHDSYADSLNAPGHEVVFFDNVPVWTMAYRGKLSDDDSLDILPEFVDERIFPFLRDALMNFEDSMPLRGPAIFERKPFRYTFEFKEGNNYKRFVAQERVDFACEDEFKNVFLQDVIGGLA